ncbi:MAG: TIGR02281 family clan AA aspartic protease [Pseudomonadales bacterium]|jgi:aspartyl protease family protein|nr:retroviral-like aspartic protease family protein [Gammaproteobacteria bacterium]|tara:strand:- start:5433 stop:5939 length:507 start_codon:yes stop_codon:yes gene_type:complete
MNVTKTGQGMMTAGVVLGMVFLTFFFGEVEEDRRNPNSDPTSRIYAESIEVPLKRNRQGHYMLVGQINGEDVVFLLDTGATDVVVPESTARRLGLPYGMRGRAMTANGPVTIYQTRIDELHLGEIRLINIDASINPNMEGAILLGMSALGQIEFSQQADTLTLKQKSG